MYSIIKYIHFQHTIHSNFTSLSNHSLYSSLPERSLLAIKASTAMNIYKFKCGHFFGFCCITVYFYGVQCAIFPSP